MLRFLFEPPRESLALSRIDGTADVASYIAALGAAEKAAGAQVFGRWGLKSGTGGFEALLAQAASLQRHLPESFAHAQKIFCCAHTCLHTMYAHVHLIIICIHAALHVHAHM